MKIQMIYLAAGSSRRFGRNKLYYAIDGKPMFCYGLDTLCEVLKKREDTFLTVVTRYDLVTEYVKKKQKIWKERIGTVNSPDSVKGISYSIRAGLAGADADYYLFCVADQPWLRTQTVLELLQKTVEGGCRGGFVQYNGVGGNPAVFSKELVPRLWELQGDNGGKKILMNHPGVCTVTAGVPEELRDIDRL